MHTLLLFVGSVFLSSGCTSDDSDPGPAGDANPSGDTDVRGQDTEVVEDTAAPTDSEPSADTSPTLDTAPPVDTEWVDDRRWPGEVWEVTSPEAEGMDSSILEGARDYAFKEGMNTQGVVIVRNGAIVAEWYAEGTDADTPATSWSMSKSMTSALIGMAVDRGELAGIDLSLAEFFPEWGGTLNEYITIRHLLEMRSGLPERTDGGGIYSEEEDQLQYSIARVAEREPGTVFAYVNEDSMLLGGVIEQFSGQSVNEYAQENLFGPLEMDAVWWTDAAGHALTYCCVDTTARDFARFGLLYARDGVWQGEQLVSSSWVAESTSPIGKDVDYYGFLWWLDPESSIYMALGYHDQYIYVIPEHDLVVVRNGLYEALGDEPVRTGDNWHSTVPPRTGWLTPAFLEPILDSVTGP